MAGWKYDKFDKVAISDDEDDTHPNIDTGSLHRMRHNHRVEQQMNLEGSIQGLEYDIEQLKVKIDAKNLAQGEFEKTLEELQTAEKTLKEKKEELAKMPMNIDTFVFNEKSSKTFFAERTPEEELKAKIEAEKNQKSEIPAEHILNAVAKNNESQNSSAAVSHEISGETKAEEPSNLDLELFKTQKDFFLKNKKSVKEFYKLKHQGNLCKFLLNHPEILTEAVEKQSLVKMVDFQFEGKSSHVNHMVYPITHLKFILQICNTTKDDKKTVVMKYFKKFFEKDPQALSTLESEVSHTLSVVRTLAENRRKQCIQDNLLEQGIEISKEDVLDPDEIIKQLPEELVRCFAARDTKMLQDVLQAMEPSMAEKYMDMCVRCGLWNPSPANKSDQTEELNEDSGEYDELPPSFLNNEIKNNTEETSKSQTAK